MSESEGNPKSESLAPQVGNSLATPRNWLELTILLTLLEWNSYGYKLMEQLTMFGFAAMNPGTMYRALRHMEKNGVVKSKWETAEAGPARRMYSITDAGEAYLELWANSLKHYQHTMDAFLRIYTGGPSQRAKEKDR